MNHNKVKKIVNAFRNETGEDDKQYHGTYSLLLTCSSRKTYSLLFTCSSRKLLQLTEVTLKGNIIKNSMCR